MKRIVKMFLLVLLVLLGGEELMRGYVFVPSAGYFFKGNKEVLKLISYVKQKNRKRIKELIDKGVDINYVGRDGVTPLYYFCLKKDYDSFLKMLQLGANPNIDPPRLFFLLNLAMYYKDDRYAKALIAYGADVNYKPLNPESPLIKALHSTIDIKYLELLLKNGAGKGVDFFKYPISHPLFSALSNREYRKIILMLEYGIELDDKVKFKIYKGETTVKQLFIEDLESETYGQFEGTKELREQLELVKYLKEKHGIEIHLKYPNGVPRK